MESQGREGEWSALMRAAAAGDAEAYRGFLTSVTPYVRAVARHRCRLLGTPEVEAEDVVQEVLLAVHLKRGTWDPARPITPWIVAIARNKVIDAFRRKGRHGVVPIDEMAEQLAAEEPEDGLSRGEIDGLIDRLKPPQGDIVRAISLDGVSVRDAAARFAMSEGAVRVALHRALKALAALYRRQAS